MGPLRHVSRIRWSAGACLVLACILPAVLDAQEQRVSGKLANIGRGFVTVRTDADEDVNVPVNGKTSVGVSGKAPRELLTVGAIVHVNGQVNWAKRNVVSGASVTLILAETSDPGAQMIAKEGDAAFGATLVARVLKLEPLVVVALPQTPKLLLLSAGGKVVGEQRLHGSNYGVVLADPMAKEIDVSFGKNLLVAGKDATVHATITKNSAPFAHSLTVIRTEAIDPAKLNPKKPKGKKR